ncbi:MAG TPA: DNA-binding protein [Chthoniobacteraceae bacterium]|jgi:hypothetical protein|nr:DNA-binding protein [Chthoniobacteraceae bacterium]
MTAEQTQQRGGGAGYPSEPLAAEKILAGRKVFFLDLKENSRGLVFKITEDVAGRRDTIMLPAEAVDEFIEALQRLADYAHKLRGGESA